MKSALPLIYSCSGCSNVAQMANNIAVRLDREYIAEMSCIAGVGGDVAFLVNLAKSGRMIIAIDGCQIECCRQCLKRHQIEPDRHFALTDFGLKKRVGMDYGESDVERIYKKIVHALESV